MRDDQSLAGLRVMERYRLDEVLATGGLSVVYRGQDDTLHRPVALKVVPRRHAALYRDALQATAALTHPAMVVALDAFEAEDRLFVVQEYVEGPAFERRLQTEPDVAWALREALRITHCLAYAHEHGVTHGDLTPAAVLLDGEDAAHVSNFRLPTDPAYLERTRRVGVRLARMLSLPDLPARPDEPTDPAALDVAAVGMLLWQALTVPVASGERHDFRPVVSMEVRQLVARLLVPGHPAPLTTAAAAARAIVDQARAAEALEADPADPMPARLHALRQMREANAHAPWADAETLVDQPAWGPSLTPPPFYAPYQGPYSPPAPAFPSYAPPSAPSASPAAEYTTIPSRRPIPSSPMRAPTTSGPLRPSMPPSPQRAPVTAGPRRAPSLSGPLNGPARPSQPGGYRPQAPVPWNDDPQVARWVAQGQSRPHGHSAPTGGLVMAPRRGIRVAPLVLIGIVLFILAFVIGYLGPPLIMLR